MHKKCVNKMHENTKITQQQLIVQQIKYEFNKKQKNKQFNIFPKYKLQYIYYIIHIFKMLSKVDKYRQMIQKARILLFNNANSYQKKVIGTLECDIKLPSIYPFRSSQQIENNIPITHHITHQQFKQFQQYPISQHNNWPKSCIGLVLCQHHQNNQTYYVYGTGILIHKKIVLTSAQNVYCRRLNTQYKSIKLIVGINDDKCSQIYDIMRIYYPKKYIAQEQNYNFAVLQLYDDLSKICGYVGWNISQNVEVDEKYTLYGYSSDQGSFNLRSLAKHKKQSQYMKMKRCLGSGLLVKENNQQCSIVGLQQSGKKYFLNAEIRNMINKWTVKTQINIIEKVGAQGCKYLSQANWTHLTSINLNDNNIRTQGCKYLSQANWTYLTTINLDNNSIGAQGCKYLSQANWAHLTQINLRNNNIGAQGCNYLSQANWTHLIQINLNQNNIGPQGCKYISQVNWKYLTIYLAWNNIGAQGCKYLSQAKWTHLTMINLTYNQMDSQGCKYLSQANWIYLTQIYLYNNNITAQGCKYLNQSNWMHLTKIDLRNNNFNVLIDRLLLQQSYPKTAIQI